MANIKEHQILKALALELKSPLTVIAREAELAGISNISYQAEQTMTLIDGYLMSAGAEYGQLSLPLEATAIGSVIYDVSQDIREYTRDQNITVTLHDELDEAVMTNRQGMRVAFACLAQAAAMSEHSEGRGDDSREIQLVAYKKRSGAYVAGVLGSQLNLTSRDLERADVLYGQSHLPFSTSLSGSGIRLAIATRLAESMSARLTICRRRGLRGVGFELVKSEQLSLV